MGRDLRPLIDAGLYDPDAADAAGQLELLDHLLDGGATIEEMQASHASRNLPALLLDRRMLHGELSARELAERLQVPLERVLEDYRLLGIPVEDPDARSYDAEEGRVLEIAQLARLVLPGDIGDEILRAIGSAVALIAESSVAAFVGSAEDELVEGSLVERARVTEASGELCIEVGTHLGPILRHHLWRAVLRQRAAMGATPDRLQSTVAVGFVDLVGFTASVGELSSTELLVFITDFQTRTFDVVTGLGGRVVKHIGDEIMFSAVDPAQACRIALALVDEFADSAALARGGLAHGVVLARHGDLYGPTVNLAARLADTAVSGEVLAAASIVDVVADAALAFEPAGRRQLKGFADPVATVAVTRTGGVTRRIVADSAREA